MQTFQIHFVLTDRGELALEGFGEGTKEDVICAVSTAACPSAGWRKRTPFNVRKEGLFRSFEWTGKGRYELRAHLTAADLRLDR